MRKLLSFALLAGVSALVFAQQPAQYTSETDHYRVISESSQSQADDVSHMMEAALALYNGIFHFDLSLLPSRYTVKVFKDQDSFNAYVEKILLGKRSDFVVIAWSDPAKSELLCYPKDQRSFTASLLHQGAVQFLKGFIDNPPLWLREGVATYLDASTWDPSAGAFHFRPNFAWLDSLKAEIRGETPARFVPFTDLINFTREMADQQQVFVPESWGLVQFLLSSADSSRSRLLWDSISVLDPKAPLEDNSARVRKRVFSWTTEQSLRKDFDAYILSLKSGNDLVREGIDFYGKGDFVRSEAALKSAVELEPDSFAAWYYLGLIAYNRRDYDTADGLYMKAFQLGANAAVINYALGVNAFAAGKNADAAKYLKFARDANPAAYADKVEALLKRIQTPAKP